MKQNKFRKNKKGYTLIELLATIVILAVIATIAVPVVLNIIKSSKLQAFKIGVFSVFDAFNYEESRLDYDEIEQLDISDLKLNNERISIGTVKRNDLEKIEVISLSDGTYCANGTREDLEIVEGDCSSLDETAPIINDIAVIKTTLSMNLIVSFSEAESLIKSYEFRLLDENDVELIGWTTGDSLTGSGLKRIATKYYDNLIQDTTYKVQVRIVNNSGNLDDTVLREEIVKLDKINVPNITYDITGYSLSKNVEITYDNNPSLIHSYMVVDKDLNIVTDWTIVDSLSREITISDYDYTVIAKSTDGITEVSNSKIIGYIDYTKPTVNVTEISNVWATSDEVTVNMEDNLSGIENWCITTYDNSDACEWIAIESILQTSKQHIIISNGTYYAFAKDVVGNISESHSFTVNKVDNVIPLPPVITASDSITSNNWHSSIYNLNISGSTSISEITYYYGTTSDPETEGNLISINNDTMGVTYYVKACNEAGICSSNVTYISKLDTKIPEVPIITASDSITSNNWHTANYTLNYSGANSASGVTYYYGTNTASMTSIGNTSITGETAGLTYYVKACNGAGTCSSNKSYIAKLDKTAPTNVYASISATTTKSITIIALGTENISEIVKYEFSKDNGSTWIDNGVVDTYTFNNLVSGSYNVKVRITNSAGLKKESALVVAETVAMTAPTCTTTSPSSWTVSKTIICTYPSGFTNYYKVNLGEWLTLEGNSKQITVTETGTVVSARTYDGTNYSGSDSITINYIDTVVPSVNITGLQNTNNITLTANITSGVSESGYTYQWYKDGAIITGATSSTYQTIAGGSFTVRVNTVARNNSGVAPIESSAYTISDYAINYNNNGGTGGPANMTKAEGLSINLSATTPTRSGYSFLGWGTSASDTSVDYNPSTKITADLNLNLYAIWKKTVTITFNANGATLGSTSLSCDMYNADASCSITSPTITRSGYTILGYNTTSSATTSAWNVSTAKNVSSNTTYYAITKKTVTITFNKNGATSQTVSGGSISTAASVTQSCTMFNTVSSCTVTSPTITGGVTPTVLGYNTTSSATSSAWNVSTAKSFSDNATYYAITRKDAITLTGTFNVRTGVSKSGGTISCTIPAVYNGATQATTCAITSPTLTASSGYTRLGWSASSSATSASYSSGAGITLSGNTTFYSVSYKNAITYTITFNANGATLSYTSKACTIPAVYNGATQVTTCSVTSPTITRSGYDAIGFNTSSSATTSTWNVNTVANVSSNATYYAITKVSYYCPSGTLTYNSSYSSSTGGYICVSNNPTSSQSCYGYSDVYTKTTYTAGTTTYSNYSPSTSSVSSCSASGSSGSNSTYTTCSSAYYTKTTYTAQTTSYTCPSGYQKTGSGSSTSCIQTTTVQSSSSYPNSFSCPGGYTSCPNYVQSTGSHLHCWYIASQQPSCNSGYTYSGGSCLAPCSGLRSASGTMCYAYHSNVNSSSGCVGKGDWMRIDGSYYCVYDSGPIPAPMSPTCSTGELWEDGKCYVYSNSVTWTSCPSGYTKSGNSCTRYYCPSGYSISGSGSSVTCTKSTTPNVSYSNYSPSTSSVSSCSASGSSGSNSTYTTCSSKKYDKTTYTSGTTTYSNYSSSTSSVLSCSESGSSGSNSTYITCSYSGQECTGGYYTDYDCPSGWSRYSGSESSMNCYKPASN